MDAIRTLAAATAGTLTLVALSAGAAGAQTPTMTVSPEPPVCSSVTLTGHSVTGGCVIHSNGEFALSVHAFGFESQVADCSAEVGLRVGGDGEGYADDIAFVDHAGKGDDCPVTPCEEAAGELVPWPAHFDEVAVGEEVLALELCMDDAGTLRRCLALLPVVVTTTHDYELVFSDLSGTEHANATNCELDGALHFEGTAFELGHN